MFSMTNEVFRISENFDQKGRFRDLSFEIIRKSSGSEGIYSPVFFKQQLLELYAAQGWTMPSGEIEETLEKAVLMVVLRRGDKLGGFFAARRYSGPCYGDFYYLERLIVAPGIRLHAVVPLAALLIFNLPGFGEKELTICAISRLKVVMSLVRLFGPRFFCSTDQVPLTHTLMFKAMIFLAILSEKRALNIGAGGLVKNVFHPAFTHDNDIRVIPGAPFEEYDAAFLMNTIPSSREKIFEVLYCSLKVCGFRFIHSIVKSLQDSSFFERGGVL